MAALIYGLLARGAEGLGRDVLGKPRSHGVEGCGYRRPRAAHGRGTDGLPAGAEDLAPASDRSVRRGQALVAEGLERQRTPCRDGFDARRPPGGENE